MARVEPARRQRRTHPRVVAPCLSPELASREHPMLAGFQRIPLGSNERRGTHDLRSGECSCEWVGGCVRVCGWGLGQSGGACVSWLLGASKWVAGVLAAASEHGYARWPSATAARSSQPFKHSLTKALRQRRGARHLQHRPTIRRTGTLSGPRRAIPRTGPKASAPPLARLPAPRTSTTTPQSSDAAGNDHTILT